MSDEPANIALLREIFGELSEGRRRAFAEAMADDFRWGFPGGWSWSGVFEPRERVVADLLQPLMAQFESYRSHATSFVAEGDRVVVQAQAQARTVRGDAYDQSYCYVFTVRDGRLREVVEYCDTALVERVLEPLTAHAGATKPDS